MGSFSRPKFFRLLISDYVTIYIELYLKVMKFFRPIVFEESTANKNMIQNYCLENFVKYTVDSVDLVVLNIWNTISF